MQTKEKTYQVWTFEETEPLVKKYMSPYDFITRIKSFTWQELETKTKVIVRIVDRYGTLLYTVYDLVDSEDFID